ncbi:MAG: magnesium-translocating P-type ATPase [Candidatus Nanoperiomorbaceae bacterium]
MQKDGQGTSLATGLTSRGAMRRLAHYGKNVIVSEHKLSGVRAYLARFRNPLVVILVLAAIISMFTNQVASAAIILVIVFLSVTLDFLSTFHSEKAAAALQKSVSVSAKVLRDRKIRSVSLARLVPGDIVQLSAGSLIPADGRIRKMTDLMVDESSLTGESFPVAKEVGDLVYLGSSVTSGEGWLEVVSTGAATEFAHIATSLHKNALTEFDLEIRRFSSLIAKITFGLVLAVLIVNVLFHRSPLDSFMFAVALAVGLTPELLPLIITLNLTKGSLKMAKKGVIVKKLSAIQNFGSMDILCTDKTGTLTENRITVARTEDFSGAIDDIILEYAYLACSFSTAYESPLDLAVLNYHKFNTAKYKKVQEIPYDFERKRESVVAKIDDADLLIAKGAPDEMFKIITKYYARLEDAQEFADHPRQEVRERRVLTDADLAQLRQEYQSLSADGFRVLAVAVRNMTRADARSGRVRELSRNRKSYKYSVKDEDEMTFVGFIAFIDPPKESAEESLAALRNSGVEVKVITGDDPLVSAHVAKELNLTVKGVLTGDQIAKMNRLQLARVAEGTTIFARVNPSQKLAVIEALRFRGHVVGYMGDGINDAPSLRAADIGISVNNAVDVAKDTADIILMKKTLSSLYDGVVEGRRTFANTVKYMMMALSSNFGNMFSMAGASILLPFLPMSASQILFNNLLYDTSQMALPGDNVDADQITRPHKMNLSAIKKFMWVFGPLSSLFDFATFGVMMLIFHASAPEFQTAWFIESLMTQTLVVFVIRTRHMPFLRSQPSWPLVLSIVGVLLVALAVMLSGLASLFGFTHLSAVVWLSITLLVVVYLVLVEIAKRIFYRHITI